MRTIRYCTNSNGVPKGFHIMKPWRRDLGSIGKMFLVQSDFLFRTDRQYWVRNHISVHFNISNHFYLKKSTGVLYIQLMSWDDTAYIRQVWKDLVPLDGEMLMCNLEEVGIWIYVLNRGVRGTFTLRLRNRITGCWWCQCKWLSWDGESKERRIYNRDNIGHVL